MTAQNNVQTWSDLHSHILPGIDDGARDVQITKELLREEQRQWVSQVLCTPHFYPEKQSLTEFLDNRQRAFQQISASAEAQSLQLQLGAEVAMSLALQGMDLRPLAMGNTKYILLEWPFGSYPLWGDAIVDAAFQQGLRPIFAHIERYHYFLGDLNRLRKYIEKGALCQMNADSVLDVDFQKQALRLIKQGYVHVLASDAHNMQSRAPNLAVAMEVVGDRLGSAFSQQLAENADRVFHGEEVKTKHSTREKKSLWKKILKRDSR